MEYRTNKIEAKLKASNKFTKTNVFVKRQSLLGVEF